MTVLIFLSIIVVLIFMCTATPAKLGLDASDVIEEYCTYNYDGSGDCIEGVATPSSEYYLLENIDVAFTSYTQSYKLFLLFLIIVFSLLFIYSILFSLMIVYCFCC